MRNLFLEKPCPKCDEEGSPTPFSKKSKLNLSLDQQPGMLESLLLSYVQVEVCRYILKLRC